MDWNEFKELLKTSGKSAVNGAFAGSPLADIINNSPELFNEAATSDTGQAIARGLTGSPITDSMPNAGNPVDNITHGLIAPSDDVALPQAAALPKETPTPSMPAPVSTPETPESDETDASQSSTVPSARTKADNDLLSQITTPNNDNQKRKDLDASLERHRKLNVIPELGANVADAIAGGASAFGANVSQQAGKEQTERDAANIGEQKDKFEKGLKEDPNSDISKQYQGLLAKFVKKDASDPSITGRSAAQISDQIPAIEKLAAMQNQKDMKELQYKTLQTNKDIALGQKKDNDQSRIENQAIQRLSSLRGDKSLQDAEAKRDASITVYNTIDALQKKGQMPSKLVYYDLLGQMWKARTGTAPTNEAIRDLDQKTFKGDLNKAATYLTGRATGGTTQSVLQNIKDFAKESGEQADQFHEAYMKPHLIKPTGLDDSRWQPIVQTARGNSFADATKHGASQSAPVTKQIGNQNYIQKDGKWYKA